MSNLDIARNVVNDLKTLDFVCNDHGDNGTIYTIIAPDDRYEIWTANGFWFIKLYRVDGRYMDHQANARFGAVGKVLVWWEVRKVLNKMRKERKLKSVNQQQEFIKSTWGEKQ